LNTTKKRDLFITISLLVGSLITAHLCFWLLPDVFEIWNAKTLDKLFSLRSALPRFSPPYNDAIVHVDLNNTTIQQLSTFYLTRSHHAQVINNLAAMDVEAQLYDFIFAARSHLEEDSELIHAARQAGNVYFGLSFELQEPSRYHLNAESEPQPDYLKNTTWYAVLKRDASSFFEGTHPLITFADLASASKGLGYLNLTADRDGVFRRLPLLVRYQDGFYPSASFRVICDYLHVTTDRIIIEPGVRIILKGVTRPGEREAREVVIPIDRRGNMLINYIGPWERMKHYNFSDVLRASQTQDERELWRDELSGKIVVVSDISTGASDLGPVPTDTHFPLSGVHANALHTILTGSFLKELSGYQMLLMEVLLLGGVLWLSLWCSPLCFSLGTLGVAVCYLGIAGACFLYGHTILHIIRPLLMITLSLIAIATYRYIKEEKEKWEGLHQRDFIRATFGRFLSNEVVEELIGSAEGLKKGAEMREVTFLVSDLRGFTALSSALTPAQVISILNRYLKSMVEIIARARGTVDEILGDGLLVFFGAPLKSDDDPHRAVACALEMQNKMVEINEEQLRHSLPPLAMGIGINTGEVVVGTIGSEKRSKYGAVGTAINTTYRIESYTTGGQILISSSTFEKVRPQLQVRRTFEVHFKGIDHPVTLYEVGGLEGNYQISLGGSASQTLTTLPSSIPMSCFLVEGKTVSRVSIPGVLTCLSNSAAEGVLERQVPPFSNLRIVLAPEHAPTLPELYAKVVQCDHPASASDDIRVRLEFTFLPEEVKIFLEKNRSGRGK